MRPVFVRAVPVFIRLLPYTMSERTAVTATEAVAVIGMAVAYLHFPPQLEANV
jgi:hypothetical protein